MTKEYYECHITMEGDKKIIQKIVEQINWTFSAIDNDIILGKGVKCYATHHYNASKRTQNQVKENLLLASTILKSYRIKVIREKIELVLYDNRMIQE